MTIPILTTQRLALRPFDLDDAHDVQRLAGDRAIAEMTQNVPHPYEDGMAEEWISGHAASFESGERLSLAVTLKDTDALVGAIGLEIDRVNVMGELGYWIAREYWRRRYAFEGARAILEYGFTDLAFNRIHAKCLSRNRASGALLRKIGMRLEGTRRAHVRKWGRFEDIDVYGLLRADWAPNVAEENQKRNFHA